MEDVKLAVCIPTYNRPEVIQEYFETVAFSYIQHGFEIFIYDSSEEAQTELVVREWMPQFKGIHYVRVDSKMHSNLKVYKIFREFGDFLEYDYLWICTDAIRWSKHVLDSVSVYIKQGYDIIIPNYRDVENIGNREYRDANNLFLDCAWHMTLYGATVLKTSTMLTNVNWDRLIEKYIVPECINHSHVAFYFEKIKDLDYWKAIHLSFSLNDLVGSSLRRASGWQKDTFYIWCYCWPAMINKLPGCYTDKKKVIKKNGINSQVLSYSNLKYLRIQNILDRGIYCCYKREWHNLTNVPCLVIWFLSIVPPDLLDSNKNSAELMLKWKIRRFCKKFNKIYIYGAGKKADRYTRYLNEMKIQFKAYLVSEPIKNTETMNDHPIILYTKEILEDGNVGILLGLNKENAKEVLNKILSGVDYKVIFSEFNKNPY